MKVKIVQAMVLHKRNQVERKEKNTILFFIFLFQNFSGKRSLKIRRLDVHT